jgi:hypothetical protein
MSIVVDQQGVQTCWKEKSFAHSQAESIGHMAEVLDPAV